MADAGAGRKTVEILWTGGYDSSFRVAQLSKLPVDIKPYYMLENRNSEKEELHAIIRIMDALKRKPGALCTFRNLELIPKIEKGSDPVIHRAFHNLLSRDYMGGQYERLACIAKMHPGIELSIHQDDKAILLISKHGALKKTCDPATGDYFVIDEENSGKDIVTLFGNFHFPLVEYTKISMKEDYANLGCEDIIDLTWFCSTPIKRQPCGVCNPCVYTIEEGLTWRFPRRALTRNKYRKFYCFLRNTYRSCRRLLKMT